MDLDQLRAQTPGCSHRIHLNNAGAALMSRSTLAAMTTHLQLEAEIGGYEAAAQAQEQIDVTYAALAQLVGGRSDEVALFDNSTHAWNAAFYSIPLGPGDRILTGRDEYGSNVLAYLQVAQRSGAEIVVVPDDGDGQIDLDALTKLVDERTKLIGLTWVPTSGGLVNPAAAVGRIARDADALYLLDATQAVGQFPVDVNDVGCDLLTGTGRKFLRGPAEPASCGSVTPPSSDSTRSSPRSAPPHGMADAASPGPPAPAASKPGRTATSTSSASAPPCNRPSSCALTPLATAPAPSVSGCGRTSDSSRASPPTTSARTVAASSPRRSPAAARMMSQLHSAEPTSTSAPPWPNTTRSTPKSAVFTHSSASPRTTTTPKRRSTEPSPP